MMEIVIQVMVIYIIETKNIHCCVLFKAMVPPPSSAGSYRTKEKTNGGRQLAMEPPNTLIMKIQ